MIENVSGKLPGCDEQADQLKDHDASWKKDDALKGQIYTALWKDNVLKVLEYDEIDVHVKNGVVTLSGHISSSASQHRIDAALESVSGILKINNHLVLDDKLVTEVSGALGELEHLYNCKFFTGASHGVVSIGGNVSTETVRSLAEKSAASNPKVRGVINKIHAMGPKPVLQPQPFLQPVIGEPIYFLNGTHGVVKQVVINPHNRRVIAMILQGNFTDQPQELTSLTSDHPRFPERTIVIGMLAIRYLTKVSGFLNIKSNVRNRYRAFDPGSFYAPNEDWIPPYPYCTCDVLFPIQYQVEDNQIVAEPQHDFFETSPNEQASGEQPNNDSLGG
jgi:osmotically-inducible protein OsmY